MIAVRMKRTIVLIALAGCHHDAAAVIAIDAVIAPDGATTVASTELCKLLSNRNDSDPSPNDVQHRANLRGADLGIPVAHDDQLFVFFGDTIGYAGIWGAGQSHPDAIGFGVDTATALAAAPERLCSGLQIITLPPAQSIGPQVDPSVIADFAGAAMTPPAGHAIAEFIHDPAGDSAHVFPNLPGDFEVPSGAFSSGDAIYVFYTTVTGPGDLAMTGSYLAKWSQPATSGPPSYQILYAVDERVDAGGALHGNFINIAAEVSGDYVYLFGTGDYRKSAVYLARKRLDALDTPGGFEELGMIIPTAGYGETSVHYYPELGRWLLLAEESLPASNRIVAYLADAPQGPWGAPIVVHDMADPVFRGTYCCAVDDQCDAPQMFDCDRTGFYGSYLFPTVIPRATGFTITYTLSSFAPYDVALFQTTFGG